MRNRFIPIFSAVILASVLTACGTANKSGSNKDKADYISMESAQAIALDAVQINAEDANISSTELEDIHGITCYKVTFDADGVTYNYSINASTGEIVEESYNEQGKENMPVSSSETVSADTIDEANAKEIALNHAGVSEADAVFVKCKPDYENGHRVYEIEFIVKSDGGYTEYDYDIDVSTGDIISYDYDAENYSPASGPDNAPAVSEDEARKTVLAKVPGAENADIYNWKLDLDDGRWEYEGKIIYDKKEYEFSVDGTNGEVIEWDVESIYD